MLKKLFEPFASLTLTVTLLALSLLLVYAGTWAQVDSGIWHVQDKYFHSFFTWVDFQTLFPRPRPGEMGIPGGFPMLGGYTLGILLLVNLLCAHALRFKFKWADVFIIPQLALGIFALHAWEKTPSPWLIVGSCVMLVTLCLTLALLHAKRTGVILIHLGIILLLVGEGITSGMAIESQMTIEEGSTANYTQDIREAELAVIDPSESQHDKVTVVRAALLRPGSVIADPELPFDIRIERFYPNSDIVEATTSEWAVTDRFGTWTVKPKPVASGTSDADKVDLPSAFLTVSKSGHNLGSFLVSTLKDHKQRVEVAGKAYDLSLRFRRHYKDYEIKLIDFRHDRYTGTTVPKNYSSQIVLNDAKNNEHREVLIKMNSPLRYRGETLFQSSFIGETITVLQVVRNPAWTLPYIACVVGGLGLCIHFAIVLVNFLRKRAKAPVPLPQSRIKNQKSKIENEYTLDPQPFWTRGAVLFPLAILLFCLYYVGAHLKAKPSAPYDLNAFGQLPVSHEGRVLPLDSLARNSMKVMLGRESFTVDGKRTPAIQWLVDLWTDGAKAESYEVFRIDHPDLLTLLELTPKKKSVFHQITGFGGPTPYRFSINDLKPKFEKLDAENQQLRGLDSKQFSPYQRRLAELHQKLGIFISISQIRGLHLVPPTGSVNEWQTIQQVVSTARDASAIPKNLHDFVRVLEDYNQKKPAEFNAATASYLASLDAQFPDVMAGVRHETFHNRFDPFTNSLVLYIIAFLLVCLSWLGWSLPLRRAAFWVLALSFLVHTFGLISRVYISGRPPVTNLASSAIFIAWGIVALAGAMELVYRNGISTAAAAISGFLSLLIAYKLSLEGDTMKVLVAVLDTNIWLATHVIIITLGYAATFLAGKLAVGYVLAGVLTPDLTAERRKNLIRKIYGITCFAVLFSFIGTVLGGIWADQSWGRFWGWDPKENGAVMIVLANALLLHARWGGIVRERGIAILAIFGNIITAWSWFGTNMLGVGLHAYGFMDSALHWLLVYVGSQILLIAIANLPLSWWRSYAAEAGVVAAGPRQKPPAAGKPRAT